ncbi:MAG TPA: hypothetical protein VFS05_04090 [Gemmatimonadaceae bacterium]|nr:hypothetical protein [Gemmatimonadaceae bacterium]
MTALRRPLSGAATARRRVLGILAAAASLALAVAGCGAPAPPAGYRAWTNSYLIRVNSDPQPPFAREPILYKVVVIDKETNQPIENGEGRIFAESHDGAKTWDSFTRGPEVGTYYGKLNFITAGDWAIAIQFRRDSTAPLERVDWMQQVRGEREGTP